MRTVLRRPAAVLPALLIGLLLLLAPAAAAAGGVDDAATALKKGRVYVDPSMTGRFSAAQAADLTRRIADADKPIFVAVVPANDAYPARTVAQDLRTKVGIVGVYAIWRGDQFKAFSDRKALPSASADRIAGAALRSHPGDVGAVLNDFVGQAVPQTHGSAVASGGVSAAAVIVPVALLALAGGGVFLLFRRAKKRREAELAAELAQLRTVVDEDITAFGEELDRLDFNPGAADADDDQRADYTRALDSYERAKTVMDAARGPEDVRPVTEALADGRFALATLAARRGGQPLPERRPPCFFDPRHGPSVRDEQWAPAGGAPRTVPVCAEDAARLARGAEPDVRTVETGNGRQPYWDAGPAYSPWAGGYYGSGLLPGLVAGTVLGAVLAPSGDAWAAGGGGHGYDAAGPDGGEYSGADFNPNDFGGFDDNGGGFDGGGFDGGGGGDFGGF